MNFFSALAILFIIPNLSLNSGWAKGKNLVWVKRPDQSRQCEKSGAESLKDGALLLSKSKIKVLDSKKIFDGKMRIQMCGAPTGAENSYRILASDLERAKTLGFQETSNSGHSGP